MSESIWEELTRSPLDPDPAYDRPAMDWLIPIVVAAILGLAVGFIALGQDPEPAATSTAMSITTPGPEAPDLPDFDPILPDGYTDTDGVGLRAIAAYGRSDNLYVVVNQATRSDTDPVETAAYHASHWTLAGSSESSATRAIESPLSPGLITLEFQGIPALPATGADVVVREASPMVVRTSCNGCGATATDQTSGEVTLDGLAEPYSLIGPLLIEVAAGITLSIDELGFDSEWGYVVWHVIEDNEVRLRPEIRILFEGTDDPDRDGDNPTQLVPEHVLGASQQNPAPANIQSFTRSGSLQLERVGELITGDNRPTAFVLQWSTEWQYPVGDPIEFTISEATYLGIVD